MSPITSGLMSRGHMPSFNILGQRVWPCISILQTYRQKWGFQLYIKMKALDNISKSQTFCNGSKNVKLNFKGKVDWPSTVSEAMEVNALKNNM